LLTIFTLPPLVFLPFPEYLFSEIEQFVIQELTMAIKVPADGADDSQNVLR